MIEETWDKVYKVERKVTLTQVIEVGGSSEEDVRQYLTSDEGMQDNDWEVVDILSAEITSIVEVQP